DTRAEAQFLGYQPVLSPARRTPLEPATLLLKPRDCNPWVALEIIPGVPKAFARPEFWRFRAKSATVSWQPLISREGDAPAEPGNLGARQESCPSPGASEAPCEKINSAKSFQRHLNSGSRKGNLDPGNLASGG